MAKPMRLEEAAELLLAALYRAIQDGTAEGGLADNLNTLVHPATSSLLLKRAANILQEREHVHGSFTGKGDYFYSITDAGILETELRLDVADSITSRLLAEGDKFVEAVWEVSAKNTASSPSSQDQIIPASDRYISRSDNQETWDQAVSSLDRIIAEFKEDRLLENSFGPEKGVLVKALEAGRQLFETGTMNVRLGIALTVEPLRTVASKYEKEIAAAVITAGTNEFIGLIKATIKFLLDQLFK